jgi:twinkle protein
MEISYQTLSHRGLPQEIAGKWRIDAKVAETGEIVGTRYTYSNGAQKHKSLDKEFYWTGPAKEAGLFGEDLFPAGSAQAITICEGEDDAPSASHMLGGYPAVSVKNGAGGAKKDCLQRLEYLNSFSKIYLCFDNDEPGRKAVSEVAALFDPNRVYDVVLEGHKDANEFLQAGKVKEFKSIWWNSKRFVPEGVVSSFDEFDKIIDEDEHSVGQPIRFQTLQDMTGGLRPGQMYLLTALEGVGKTELMRHFEYDVLRDTDANIGVIHLEESKGELLKRYATYDLGVPVHEQDYAVSKEEIKESIRRIVNRDERLHVYSHGDTDDPRLILDVIRSLVAGFGCRFIFLDHVNNLVSGAEEDDERRCLDYLLTRLGLMVRELDFCLVLISHINDLGQTRGSRYISKIAGTWVELSRDLTAESEFMRNQIHLLVKKNRPARRTGPAGKLFLSLDDYQLHEVREKELPV